MNTVIVDGNSIGYANHNAMTLTVGGAQVQAIFGFMKTIISLRQRYIKKEWELIVLWDGKAQWRFDLLPEYKSNRRNLDPKSALRKELCKKQVPLIQKGLEYLGVRQMLVSSAEADDIAGFLTKRIAESGSKTVLVTGDQDWLMLIREGVTWHDPIRDNVVSQGNFFEFTGYTSTAAFLDGKALMGDTSDCIEPTGGIGEKGAPEFLAQFGSVDNFFAQVESGKFVPKKKAHTNLVTPETRARFERNRKLMNLIDVPRFAKEDTAINNGEFNPAKFLGFCERLAFKSIIANFDVTMRLFQPASK